MSRGGKVRVGLIGAGWWATCAHIPGLQSHPDAEIVAVSRRSPEKLSAVAERYGIPAAQLRDRLAAGRLRSAEFIPHRAAMVHGKRHKFRAPEKGELRTAERLNETRWRWSNIRKPRLATFGPRLIFGFDGELDWP